MVEKVTYTEEVPIFKFLGYEIKAELIIDETGEWYWVKAKIIEDFTPYFALGHSASYLAEERIIGVCRTEEEARKRLEIAKEKISDEIRARIKEEIIKIKEAI